MDIMYSSPRLLDMDRLDGATATTINFLKNYPAPRLYASSSDAQCIAHAGVAEPENFRGAHKPPARRLSGSRSLEHGNDARRGNLRGASEKTPILRITEAALFAHPASSHPLRARGENRLGKAFSVCMDAVWFPLAR